MRHHQSSTLAALYQIHCAHFPIGSTLISSGLGRPILWANRHGLHLLKLLKYILDYRHPWIWRTAFTGTGFVIQIHTTPVANSSAIFPAQHLHWQIQQQFVTDQLVYIQIITIQIGLFIEILCTFLSCPA